MMKWALPGCFGFAANTFSATRLYDHESTTYASVFGRFFNLKRANRVILTRIGGNPTSAAIQANARRHAAGLGRNRGRPVVEAPGAVEAIAGRGVGLRGISYG